MAIVGLPSIPVARIFPLPPSARIFPVSPAAVSNAPYSSSSLATVLLRVRERLLYDFWTDAELTLYIQEGLRIWNTLTGYYRERVPITFAATSTQYDVPTLITDGLTVLRLDTASAHLDGVALSEIGEFAPTYQSTAAGTPLTWIPMGLNQIALYPQPAVAFDATVDYIRQAPVPLVASDNIQMGEEDLAALVDYATWAARLKEGGQELQDAMPLLQAFLRQAGKYNSRLLSSSIYRKLIGMPAGGQDNLRPDSRTSAPFRR